SCRYASMPLFDVSMFEGVMNVNWRKLEKLTKAVAAVVNKAVLVDISTPNGTRLTLSKEKRKALSDTGILSASGAFGNLPAGEVFLAPLEGTANGKLVLEWSPTKKLAAPIKLTVKDGTAREIFGDGPFASYLKSKLAEREENRNIAEFGIGTNERARRPDNILESEKILGTIHVALGDNSSFGGKVKTPFHLDFVFFKPTVRLSTKNGETITLIEKGALLT
ncbi:MAG TPA: aminopeptidase, partial [Dissulfurispiraceae bacterium]|nr:aminopeptidase [Dissulfurispiraceae bacterium]